MPQSSRHFQVVLKHSHQKNVAYDIRIIMYRRPALCRCNDDVSVTLQGSLAAPLPGLVSRIGHLGSSSVNDLQ